MADYDPYWDSYYKKQREYDQWCASEHDRFEREIEEDSVKDAKQIICSPKFPSWTKPANQPTMPPKMTEAEKHLQK